jgi:hypothetical protein
MAEAVINGDEEKIGDMTNNEDIYGGDWDIRE